MPDLNDLIDNHIQSIQILELEDCEPMYLIQCDNGAFLRASRHAFKNMLGLEKTEELFGVSH